jgi:hypothetical protein
MATIDVCRRPANVIAISKRVGGEQMRRFRLVRFVDVSGVSGTGVVAEGVQFDDGQVAVSWFGKHHCVSVWPSVEDVEAIHGHEGATVIEWED